MAPMYRFDQLYVISDIHLGGTPGRQIFGSGAALAWLVGTCLQQLDSSRQIGLVINGDFVDFLAEPDARHFDPHHAVAKLERIALSEPEFSQVFRALTAFVRTPARHLIVNLGNHDIELALPWVRQRLIDLILGDQPGGGDAARRLHVVSDGTGVLCEVGGRSVLCVHGNEVDRWNPVDFERVREIGRDLQLGRPVLPWIPNAGARMVIDVMNEIKRDFPFVDLLKPENDAVGRVLAACGGPDLLSIDRLTNAAMTFGSRFGASISKPRGLLGEDPEETALEPADGWRAVVPDRPALVEALMAEAEDATVRDVDPLSLIEGDESEALGDFGAAWRWVKGDSNSEILRESLDRLDIDPSFDLTLRDDTARLLDAQISPSVDFLVAGHTHLARARRRINGSGYYYNSGTWARLIRITPAVRKDPAAFAKLFRVLKNGDMASLDAEPGLVHKLNMVVAIRAAGPVGATGELTQVVPITDDDDPFKLQPVAGSAFTRA
jgi:UDP-2,3-diacylglucosamine pyrophosphatase LpxH